MSVKLPETERRRRRCCRWWWRRSRKKKRSESTRDRRGTSANGGYGGEGDLVPLCTKSDRNLILELEMRGEEEETLVHVITLFG